MAAPVYQTRAPSDLFLPVRIFLQKFFQTAHSPEFLRLIHLKIAANVAGGLNHT